MLATAMPIRNAVGTSLVVIMALGLTTATSYAFSELVDWRIAGLLVLGGLAGAIVRIVLGRRLGVRKGLLEHLFAILVVTVGGYVAIGLVAIYERRGVKPDLACEVAEQMRAKSASAAYARDKLGDSFHSQVCLDNLYSAATIASGVVLPLILSLQQP